MKILINGIITLFIFLSSKWVFIFSFSSYVSDLPTGFEFISIKHCTPICPNPWNQQQSNIFRSQRATENIRTGKISVNIDDINDDTKNSYKKNIGLKLDLTLFIPRQVMIFDKRMTPAVKRLYHFKFSDYSIVIKWHSV